jgi:hypothetical protein
MHLYAYLVKYSPERKMSRIEAVNKHPEIDTLGTRLSNLEQIASFLDLAI